MFKCYGPSKDDIGLHIGITIKVTLSKDLKEVREGP